jgi:signal transduction histidine kinase
VQGWAESVRVRTQALFVVVTDARGVRYSHPDPVLLGQQVSIDQIQALGGDEVAIFGPSAVGLSARGKVPLRDTSGNVVGQVIVAISADNINHHLLGLLRTAAAFLGIALALGAAGAIGLTRRLKRQTFGLEPASLGLLLEQQAALRRVATLVARGVSPNEVFAAVTVAVGQLLGAQSTCLLRYEPDGTATVVAAWSDREEMLAVGTRVSLAGDPIARAVLQSGRPTRFDAGAESVRAAGLGGAQVWSAVGAPVVVEGGLMGAMTAAWTEPVAVSAETEGRIAEFTELVATAIANADSQAALAASRARVIAAADESRRRIERDLHDGTQQRLVSLGLELRAAESAVPPEMTDVRAQVSRAALGVAEALQELQEISRGIHPAILSRGGLVPALKVLARRSAVAVELDVHNDQQLPDGVEAAAYYVVSEALANAAKHADASVVRVRLDARDGEVRLEVNDDGVGGADPAKGSGLVGLRDRVEALGGKLHITSTVGEGTTLVVTLPFDAA